MEDGKNEMYNEFFDKNVVIVYTDGYKKAGHVLAIDNHFVKLKYYSGNVEMINLNALKSIKVETSSR